MHSNLSKFFILSIIGLLCSQCSKEKLFRLENLPPTLYVVGQVDPSIGIDVLVTRTVSTSDTVNIRDLLVKDAKVILVNENGARFEIPPISDGKYVRDTSGLSLHAGGKYRVEVSAPDLPEVQSLWVIIPEIVLSDTLSFALDGGFNGNSPTGKGFLGFMPQGGINTCYLLRMVGVIDGRPQIRANFDIEISQLCEVYQRNGDACFDNTCFGANAPAQCLFKADAAFYFPATSEQENFDKMLMRFGIVGTEYRAYLFSLEQPEEWENGLVEPKPSFSNITGGWGVFFASNTVEKVVAL